MNSNRKTANRSALVLSSAVCLASGFLGSSALAEQPRSETVKFQDLDLNTPEGVRQLYGRIHAAASRVCTQFDPILRPAASICARKAERDAIARVSLPQLEAYYRATTGDATQPLIAGR